MSGDTSVRWSRVLPVIIVVGVMTTFGVVSMVARTLYEHTEDRLLQQRTDEAGAVLSAAVADIRTPLDAAASAAAATDGDPTTFAQVVGAYVGDGKVFTSAELFRAGSAVPVATVGVPPALPASGDQSVASVFSAVATHPFVIVDLLHGDHLRIGYASVSSAAPLYIAYGERTLSDTPNVRKRTDQPFSGLDYAIYLGDRVDGGELLGASTTGLPLAGRTATTALAFGDRSLLLVMSPIGRLSSALFAALWWIVLLLGAAISAAVAALTWRLLRRRDAALVLARENERLYDEQRQIANTLQLSLLPQLEAPDGAHVTARYWPAGAANLIGGDFYDVFRVDERRWGITIGDVCGKGIEAAAITGLTRHTIRAAARRETSPAAVLEAVHEALADVQPATFCTACFLFVIHEPDGTQRIDLSLGGHPPPILRRADGSISFLGAAGTLLGMVPPRLQRMTAEVGPGDVLVLYTDGLTDAPAGQAVAIEEVVTLLDEHGDRPLDQVAAAIRAVKRSRRPAGSGDDTAVLLIRFGAIEAVETAAAMTAPGTSTRAT